MYITNGTPTQEEYQAMYDDLTAKEEQKQSDKYKEVLSHLSNMTDDERDEFIFKKLDESFTVRFQLIKR
jgi:formate dehydrogenase maturation protein FdhE